MSGLNYLKLGITLSNICSTTQLDNATKCHYAFKIFWGEPCKSNMNRLIKEISSQNLEVFCILAMRLHETPKGSNSYRLLKSFIQSNVPWISIKAVNTILL